MQFQIEKNRNKQKKSQSQRSKQVVDASEKNYRLTNSTMQRSSFLLQATHGWLQEKPKGREVNNTAYYGTPT